MPQSSSQAHSWAQRNSLSYLMKFPFLADTESGCSPLKFLLYPALNGFQYDLSTVGKLVKAPWKNVQLIFLVHRSGRTAREAATSLEWGRTGLCEQSWHLLLPGIVWGLSTTCSPKLSSKKVPRSATLLERLRGSCCSKVSEALEGSTFSAIWDTYIWIQSGQGIDENRGSI